MHVYAAYVYAVLHKSDDMIISVIPCLSFICMCRTRTDGTLTAVSTNVFIEKDGGRGQEYTKYGAWTLHTIQYNTVQYSTVQYSTVQYWEFL